jgi:arylsulfatase A-like enzyme
MPASAGLGKSSYQAGRLSQVDNTLIRVLSDNGASSEGGPTGSVNENKFFNNVPDDLKQNLAAINDLGGPKYFNHYAWGWTHAGNTPFRRWKRETSSTVRTALRRPCKCRRRTRRVY